VKLRIAITGAGGFLGAALCHRLPAAGMEVHALARRPVVMPGVRWHPYDLAGAPPAVLAEVDVLIHAAFSLGAPGPAREELNETAARRLLDVARAHRTHFVFISSMSAHAGAVSSYGRAKWKIEQCLDPAVDAIVRPGLIIGPGGVYAHMLASLRRTPVLPVFYGGVQPVQPIGLDDLVEGLQRIVTGRLSGAFNLGSNEPIMIRELYRRMLAATGLRRALVPLPGDLTVLCLRVAERLGLRPPLTVENLLGQKHLRAFETAASLTRLGLSLTPPAALPWNIPVPTP
jgi:NADH dehydrogenase